MNFERLCYCILELNVDYHQLESIGNRDQRTITQKIAKVKIFWLGRFFVRSWTNTTSSSQIDFIKLNLLTSIFLINNNNNKIICDRLCRLMPVVTAVMVWCQFLTVIQQHDTQNQDYQVSSRNYRKMICYYWGYRCAVSFHNVMGI